MAQRRWKWWALASLGGVWALRRARAISFRERVVLITGGSRGLGLLLAREFGCRGARVALCARDAAELERAKSLLGADGISVFVAPCDVSQPGQVRDLVARVEREVGPIEVLVNNAGVATVGPVEAMTEGDFATAMGVHFWGPLHTTLAVLPGMHARRWGRIVNVSSIGGKVAVPHLLPYSASKFALTGLSEGLRSELHKDGIRVTTVCPGLMRTGSPAQAEFIGKPDAEHAWFSISDALPLCSMSAMRAARQIASACARGDSQVILSWQAKLLAWVHGLVPGTVADVLGLVHRMLPDPGATPRRARGLEVPSRWAPSRLTALGDHAAKRNNELPPGLLPPGMAH
jgi:NAD(P)-dependent dehydrogenase (short-subunit alcohol dehydrogenase family)